MHVGRKLESKASKYETILKELLDPDEFVTAVYGVTGFRPLVQLLVLTTKRLATMSTSAQPPALAQSFPLAEVVDARVTSKVGGVRVEFTAPGGESQRLASLAHAADETDLRERIEQLFPRCHSQAKREPDFRPTAHQTDVDAGAPPNLEGVATLAAATPEHQVPYRPHHKAAAPLGFAGEEPVLAITQVAGTPENPTGADSAQTMAGVPTFGAGDAPPASLEVSGNNGPGSESDRSSPGDGSVPAPGDVDWASQAQTWEREVVANATPLLAAATEYTRAVNARLQRYLLYVDTGAAADLWIDVDGLTRLLEPELTVQVESVGTVTKEQGWLVKETTDTRQTHVTLSGRGWSKTVKFSPSTAQFTWGQPNSRFETKAREFASSIRDKASNVESLEARLIEPRAKSLTDFEAAVAASDDFLAVDKLWQDWRADRAAQAALDLEEGCPGGKAERATLMRLQQMLTGEPSEQWVGNFGLPTESVAQGRRATKRSDKLCERARAAVKGGLVGIGVANGGRLVAIRPQGTYVVLDRGADPHSQLLHLALARINAHISATEPATVWRPFWAVSERGAEHAGARSDPATPTPAGVATGPEAIPDQLAKLAALHQAGALTDQEFALAKQRLLAD